MGNDRKPFYFMLFLTFVLFNSRYASAAYLLIAVFAFARFLMIALDRSQSYNQNMPVSSTQPGSAAGARVELPERKMPPSIPADLKCHSCGASIKPTDKECAFCGSQLRPLIELPEPAHLGSLKVGDTIHITSPQTGAPQAGGSAYYVRGRLLYTELWQASRGPNVPWSPTGNTFAGFVLDQDTYLLNWQSRFYILKALQTLTDMDINRDFLPYAKQFAQSDQTARVEFSYAGARWKIDDIGRFAIDSVEGAGAHLGAGAIGRFIHCSSKDKALVVEDFQSGGSGGQDMLWQGYLIKPGDIHN